MGKNPKNGLKMDNFDWIKYSQLFRKKIIITSVFMKK
jgi:hypothetical protein